MEDRLAAMLATAEEVCLDIAKIREPHQVLRGPERHNPMYLDMRESVRTLGVYVPILVRPDPDRGPGYYILIDGMQRLTISRETGKTTIPARVLNVSERESLEIQLIVNLHRVETTPIQYAEHLNLMMALDPKLTAPKLAVKLAKSPPWVYGVLGLLKLDPRVATLVEQGKIVLANAQALAKLPLKHQAEYIPLALAQQPVEFKPKITEIARRLKEATKGGRKPKEYIHVDHFQKMNAVRREIEHGEARQALFREFGDLTPERAWTLALEWVLHRDAISVRQAKAKEAKLLGLRAAKDRELEEEAKLRRGE